MSKVWACHLKRDVASCSLGVLFLHPVPRSVAGGFLPRLWGGCGHARHCIQQQGGSLKARQASANGVQHVIL